MSEQQVEAELKKLRSSFAEFKQEHVFAFLDKGNFTAEQKKQLYNDLKGIKLAELQASVRTVLATNESKKSDDTFKPFEATTVKDEADPATKRRWRDGGLRAIAEGKVAVVLMAGGQGTRLGASGPKGCYDIGLPSHKSLFQIQAERISRLVQLAATSNPGATKAAMPWYIMTSEHTRAPSEEFFKKHNHFGLNPKDVWFFEQAELPAVTSAGKIIMESVSKVAMSPNGNGGVYPALRDEGVLADMKKRGIQFVHIYGVDNVLVKIGDPYLVGFAVEKKADCINKVVLRTDPNEKVGAMCLRNGQPCVVEYTEVMQLCKDMATARDSKTGHLVMNAANIVNHFYSLKFLEKMADGKQPLSFHVAKKKIPSVTETGSKTEIDGIKMEMFVFDVFPFCPEMLAFAVSRSEEFSPVKNAPGPGTIDSPDTARRDITKYHMELAKAAGAVFDDGDKDAFFEISPLVSYDGENLDQLKGKKIKRPYFLDVSSTSAASAETSSQQPTKEGKAEGQGQKEQQPPLLGQAPIQSGFQQDPQATTATYVNMTPMFGIHGSLGVPMFASPYYGQLSYTPSGGKLGQDGDDGNPKSPVSLGASHSPLLSVLNMGTHSPLMQPMTTSVGAGGHQLPMNMNIGMLAQMQGSYQSHRPQRECFQWSEHGTCSFGDRCRFAHAGQAPVRQSRPFKSTNPCYLWRDSGSCSFGSNCRFSHDLSQTQQYNSGAGGSTTTSWGPPGSSSYQGATSQTSKSSGTNSNSQPQQQPTGGMSYLAAASAGLSSQTPSSASGPGSGSRSSGQSQSSSSSQQQQQGGSGSGSSKGGNGVCFRWSETGKCRFGRDCRYLHEYPSGSGGSSSAGSSVFHQYQPQQYQTHAQQLPSSPLLYGSPLLQMPSSVTTSGAGLSVTGYGTPSFVPLSYLSALGSAGQLQQTQQSGGVKASLGPQFLQDDEHDQQEGEGGDY